MAEVFSLRAGFVRGTRWGLLACVVIGILFCASPFLLGEDPYEWDGSVVVGAILFFGLALMGYRVASRPSQFSVRVHDEGVASGSDSLTCPAVPWAAISGFRERPILQRLDVLDDESRCIAKFEYQLDGFDRLVGIVLERMPADRLELAVGDEYELRRIEQAFPLVVMAVFSALAISIWEQSRILSAMTGLVLIVGGREYLATVTKLTISASGLRIRRLGRLRVVSLDRIEAIFLDFRERSGTFRPMACLLEFGEVKPIEFNRLTKSNIQFAEQLRRFVEANRPAT